MYCKKCGKEIEDNWIVCPYCNEIVLNNTANQSQINEENLNKKDGYTINREENDADVVADNEQQYLPETDLDKSNHLKKMSYSVIGWAITIVLVLVLWSVLKNIGRVILPNSAKNAPSSTTLSVGNGENDTSNPIDDYTENAAVDSSIEADGTDENSTQSYIGDTISYDGWSISVRYAYTASTYVDQFYVKVNCFIKNISNSIKEFNTSEFSLNNNGIIEDTVGIGGYEYTEIAPDGSFNTDIEFLCPNNSNRILDNMTMNVGNATVCLGYRPQPEEFRDEFFGVYINCKGTESEKTMVIAPTEREGMYSITTYFYSDVFNEMSIIDEDDIVLEEGNLFEFSGQYYKWVPEEQRIYKSDNTDINVINDKISPLEKQ